MLDIFADLYGRMGLMGSLITGLIIIIFISGFYANVLIRRKYLSLSLELAAYCAGEISGFKSEMLTWLTEEYKESLHNGLEAVNTGAIIDMAMEAYQKPCVLGEIYLKKVGGLLITTGLFGTFTGLTVAVGNIGSMLSQTSAEALMAEAAINTFKVLVSSFEGMSVAFITSLFGTGFSILFSLLTTFMGASDARRLFITQVEEYLDVKLASEFMGENSKSLDQSDQLNTLSTIVTDSINVFNQAVTGYTEELQSLKGLHKEWRQDLEQWDKSVALLCQSLDKTSETFYQSGIGIYSCTETLNRLVNELGSENNRLDGLHKILDKLSQKLDESEEDRKIFLKIVDDIPDKLLNYNEAAVARIERGR
ncbi:MAG TPA: hypothetical protein DD738_07335 [Ruminiclostridium sp.]|nr:hypothetical protein [Ruminiclostridium sp.]